MNPSPPDLWTFSCDGATFSASQLGVGDLVRHRVSQGLDTCRIVPAGRRGDDAPVFPLNGTVAVARAGTGWFTGRVTALPGGGDGAGEAQTRVLSGPWWYLEQLVCQQSWSLRGGAGNGLLSRLVLGQAADGTRLTTGEVIRETLQYAMDAGAPFQIGTIEPDLYPPLEVARDVTCAQVIQRMLRWHPDCAAWFDYASAPVPTFHCRARAGLPAVSLTLGQPPLAAVRGLSARPELQATAAVLNYTLAIPAADGGASLLDVLTDAAPAGATGREFGAAVRTLPLRLGTGAAVTGGAAAAAALALAAFPAGAGAAGASLAAASLRARAGQPPYSGSVVLLEENAGATGEGLGRTLNVAGGGSAEWAAMGALIVAEEVQAAAGRTTWTLGTIAAEAAAGGGALQEALRTTRPGAEGRESEGLAWLDAGVSRAGGREG